MEMCNLFFEEPKIDLNTLNEMSFNDWKTLGKKIRMENFNEIYSFYELEYSNENPPYYHCFPEYNELSNTNNHKYIIVEQDNDQVFIAYKIIQIMGNNLIKIYDKPISKLGNKQLEQDIINVLMTKNFFKFTYKEKYSYLYGEGELSYPDCDNYYNYDIMKDKYTNKYMKKHLFYRFNEPEFRVEFTNSVNIEQSVKLRQQWEDCKNNGKGENVFAYGNSKGYKKFLEFINGRNDFNILNIYYRDELILQYVYLIYENSYINLFRATLSRTVHETGDDTWVQNTFSRLDSFAVYYTLNNVKDIKYIYYAGCAPSNKSLFEYKKAHSNGCVTYYTKNSKR